jgi:hypothetical protein
LLTSGKSGTIVSASATGSAGQLRKWGSAARGGRRAPRATIRCRPASSPSRPALPTVRPPRPAQRGAGGAPTSVANVETLAHLALIARFGAAWFRSVGTVDQPGTLLVTIGGAVGRAGIVVERAAGTPLAFAVAAAGGPDHTSQAVLSGGYGHLDGRPCLAASAAPFIPIPREADR